MVHPVEGPEERSDSRYFDVGDWRTDLLIRPINRSVSELTLCGNGIGVRPRANSLQDDRRFTSPSGSETLGDPVAMRSLLTPVIPPLLSGRLAPGRSLNAGAPPFIPPPGLKTPPTEPSEDATTMIPPLTPNLSPIVEPVEETHPPSPHLGGEDFTSSACSTSSTLSTVKPMVPVIAAVGSELPLKQGYSRAERRAVETVINVLLEMKSKGEGRVSLGSLPPLVLAKDRTVYRNVGHRANRFWRLIDLGVQMGWLETGPEKAWIDVGKGWTEDTEPLC